MRGAVQMQITTIGLDIAKNVFQVHGIDAKEKVVVRKQLRRSQVIAFFKALPPCLIGMEACATTGHAAAPASPRTPAAASVISQAYPGQGCMGTGYVEACR
jgi:hypothetical protein